MLQRKQRPAPSPRRPDKLPAVPVMRPEADAKDTPADKAPDFDDEAIRRMVEAAYT
jgi:hypothetical protein